MTKLENQIRELSPSVKDALYRRLLFAEDLGWLRDEKKKDCVIGFELDLNEQELSGFALIAIQRHTVIAFVSDRDEDPRLILFPSLEILFDPGFELLDLIVTRKEFKDSMFDGVVTGHGRFGDMVKDLTPPNRKVDLSNTVLDQIANIIEKEEEEKAGVQGNTVGNNASVNTPVRNITKPVMTKEPIAEEPEYITEDEPGYMDGPPDGYIEDEPDNFDDYMEPGYDDYEDYEESEQEPVSEIQQSRSEMLKSQKFTSLSEVIDYTVMKLGINRPLAVTLANKAMQSKVSPEYRVELAVKIFCKLIDEDKI